MLRGATGPELREEPELPKRSQPPELLDDVPVEGLVEAAGREVGSPNLRQPAAASEERVAPDCPPTFPLPRLAAAGEDEPVARLIALRCCSNGTRSDVVGVRRL